MIPDADDEMLDLDGFKGGLGLSFGYGELNCAPRVRAYFCRQNPTLSISLAQYQRLILPTL